VGIYERKKERKHTLDQESKIEEKTIMIKKKKTEIRIKPLASL